MFHGWINPHVNWMMREKRDQVTRPLGSTKKSSGPSSARKKKEHSRFGERNYTPPGWKVLQMGSWDMETI